MHDFAKLLLASLLFPSALAMSAEPAAPTAIDCSSCAAWNKPQKPFNIYGNTWYVGTTELSALLITSPQGHVLLDGALPQSAPLIEASIKALGFRVEDIKLIVNSHAHFDHAGGIAALQQASGARVVASESGAFAMSRGGIDPAEPQYTGNPKYAFPKTDKVAVVGEGEVITVGPIRITAHMTPGHTPGGTSWSWQSCENKRCLDVVYADSLTPVSEDGFYFTGKGGRTPDLSASFAATINKVGALKCDIMVATHPGFSNTMQKAAARTPTSNPFIDPDSCRSYAAGAMKRLNDRLAKERAEK